MDLPAEAADAVVRLLRFGMPLEVLLDLVADVQGRIAQGRPGRVEAYLQVGPHRITGACVRRETHYPAKMLGR